MKRFAKVHKWEWALALASVLCIFYAAVSAEGESVEAIRENTVRLHIVATSDSPEDQALKLQVRDAVLARSDELFGDLEDKEEALDAIREKLPAIEEAAEAALRENGCQEPVRAGVTNLYFDIKRYGDRAILPAGEYDALQLVIGEGQGHNWWCVMFPPLCVPTASEQTPDSVYGEAAGEIDPAQGVEVKFKVVEWFEGVQRFFSGEKSAEHYTH